VAEDFLSSLEKGHVSVSHSKEKEAVPETAPAITVEGMPASSGRRRGPTPQQTRKQMKALHLTFKKVAFWPVVAMAVAMFVVASMSIKSIVSTRSLVPATVNDEKLINGRIIDSKGEQIGRGEIRDGYLVMINEDGQESDLGPVQAQEGPKRPSEVFAILSVLFGVLLSFAAFSFMRDVLRSRRLE
jgi:hypothetical protein